MTEIPNSQKLVFNLICDLDIVIWNLFEIWCLSIVISLISELGYSYSIILVVNVSKMPTIVCNNIRPAPTGTAK